jgi:hypothetical protein
MLRPVLTLCPEAAYPIYRSELPAYDKLRLNEFWQHPDFDMYDVTRKPVTL